MEDWKTGEGSNIRLSCFRTFGILNRENGPWTRKRGCVSGNAGSGARMALRDLYSILLYVWEASARSNWIKTLMTLNHWSAESHSHPNPFDLRMASIARPFLSTSDLPYRYSYLCPARSPQTMPSPYYWHCRSLPSSSSTSSHCCSWVSCHH
jgi:hypothetical protein